MKERYLIAFDMDGTLLNSKKKISFLTKIYLRKLARKGHKIILASGRPSRSLISYYKDLRLDTPIICYNGAYSFSPADKNYKSHIFAFPKEMVKTLSKEFAPYIDNVMCESDTDIWVDKIDKYLDIFFWFKGMNIHEGNIDDILNEDPMTMIAKRKDINAPTEPLFEIIKKYENTGISLRLWTGSPYFELYFKETSKGASIKEIADYYNIPKERIISFGDAENDNEMFEVSGIPIAMKNAKESVKRLTKNISVKDNDHNGIYWTLKKIIK